MRKQSGAHFHWSFGKKLLPYSKTSCAFLVVLLFVPSPCWVSIEAKEEAENPFKGKKSFNHTHQADQAASQRRRKVWERKKKSIIALAASFSSSVARFLLNRERISMIDARQVYSITAALPTYRIQYIQGWSSCNGKRTNTFSTFLHFFCIL